MEYTTKKIEDGRRIVRDQEQRVARQRANLAQAVADRHPADELQARLLIMEQSLLCMARFLRNLERDLQDELSLQKRQTQKRIRRARDAAAVPPLAEKTAVPPAAETPPAPFETITKAMRKLSGM